MIDKLEIRIPAQTPIGNELEPVYSDLRRGFLVPGFKPSLHYKYTGDLRPFGINAIAHLECKRSHSPNHKLELLDTGSAGFSELLARAEDVFRFNPLQAEVMRVDAAADIPGIPVSFFESAAYATHKRFAADIARLECLRIGGREVETIYLGKRPNCIRIYNKAEEYRHQYRTLALKLKPNACILPFERVYGISKEAILTRVERQMAGGRVPRQLLTVAKLQQNAADFNPFECLRLSRGGGRLPTPDEVGLASWLQGMQIRNLVLQNGMQRTRRFVNRHSSANTARIFNRFAAFLPSSEFEQFSGKRLYEIYRESVERQLAA